MVKNYRTMRKHFKGAAERNSEVMKSVVWSEIVDGRKVDSDVKALR